MALVGEMIIHASKIVMSKNTLRIDENGYLHAISCPARSPWQSIKDDILFGYRLIRSGIMLSWSASKPDLEMGRGQRLGPGLGRPEGQVRIASFLGVSRL